MKMILTDKEIRELKLIEPFNEEQLTPNGYDVSCNEDVVMFPRRPSVLVTNETIKLPNNIVAQIWLKTKWARQGIQATFGMIDAGFNGTLALSLYNGSDIFIVASKNSTIAQIVFFKLDRNVEKEYAERSGNYQHQKEKLIV
jgi:dCTP deaminase